MERDQDVLSEAIEQLRNETVQPGPPQGVVDAALNALEAAGAAENPRPAIAIRFTAKIAVAAAVLLLAGYAVGRVSAPAAPDMDQLKQELAVSIEPVIRERVIDDMRQQWQVVLAGGFMRLKDDLTQQYRADLNRFAVQTLAASNAVTNQLLGQLVQGINTAQTEKMHQVAGALQQIERNRLKDRSQLAAGLEALACQTEDGLQQTREEFVQLLVQTYPSIEAPGRRQDTGEERTD